MGGRGSFSKLLRTIDDVLGAGDKADPPIKELATDNFHSLEQTEDLIRKKGKEVMVVFDRKGKAIKAYEGNATSVSFPVSEAEKWKGCIVTHNHPKGTEGFGGTFSFADISNATVYEFASHRAVASGQGEHNYILRAGPDARPMELNRRIAADIATLRTEMRRTATRVREQYRRNPGKFKNYGHMLHIARQKSVGLLNSYYREVAKQYGYIYRAQK